MDLSQDIIVEQLKAKFMALSKQSTDEDHYLYNYLIDNGLMNLNISGTITITNAGQDFLRNSYYWNPVPIDIAEWRSNITSQLKDGEKHLDGTGDLFTRARKELIQDGIIEIGTYNTWHTLTSKGRRYINSGKPYDEFINPNIPPIVHIGHNISGAIHKSRLNMDANNKVHVMNNNTAHINPIQSWVVWIITIVGFIGSIITIYLFFK